MKVVLQKKIWPHVVQLCVGFVALILLAWILPPPESPIVDAQNPDAPPHRYSKERYILPWTILFLTNGVILLVFHRKKRVSVDETGIYDECDFKIGLIPWAEIKNATVKTIEKCDYLHLDLRDKQRYLENNAAAKKADAAPWPIIQPGYDVPIENRPFYYNLTHLGIDTYSFLLLLNNLKNDGPQEAEIVAASPASSERTFTKEELRTELLSQFNQAWTKQQKRWLYETWLENLGGPLAMLLTVLFLCIGKVFLGLFKPDMSWQSEVLMWIVLFTLVIGTWCLLHLLHKRWLRSPRVQKMLEA